MGRQLVVENTPAKCMYRTGEIFCLYDERIPLTEPRLVHEFVHRAARRQVLFVWTSGLDTNRSRTLLNEVLTEYLTKCIMGERYADRADTRNLYRPLMGDIEALEKRIGRAAIVRAYLKGNYRFFRRQLSASRIRLPY